jgi:cobalamin biosynthesis protein CobT
MLARLLATENIRVEHNAGAETAMFDIKNRVLVLPVWDSMTEAMYDMLVGHEVSHALHTPMDEWDEATKDMFVCQRRNFQQVCNVVEDARIERLIKDRFPGLKRDFSKAYAELHDRDLFEINNKNLSEMTLIDRLNLEFKLGLFGLVQVPFSADEKQYVTRMAETKTFADVLELTNDLFNDWKQEQQQQEGQQGQSQENSDEEQNDESAINGDSDDASCDNEDGEESQEDGGQCDAEETDETSQDGADSGSGEGDEESQQDSEESQDGSGQEQCDCPECTASREAKEETQSDDDAGASDGEENSEESQDGEDGEEGTQPSTMNYEDYAEGGTVSGPSETQDAMEKAISSMRNSEISSVDYYTIPSEMNLESSIVDFSRVREIWDAFYTERDASRAKSNRTFDEDDNAECDQFLVRSKSVVNHMVQQFQMKQAADEDRRTSIAKTGVLDTTTMINYRWSEDIFLKNQTVADGKSHGMIMYLDWSGSMDCILKDTVEQLLILTEFCNKMQIPFEVYAFTSRQINGDFINDKGNVELKELEWMTPADNAVGCRQLRAHSYSLINFLSSRMNIRQYKKAVRELFLCSNQRYGDIPNQFSTGCTPLNEAIMCALQQVPAFQERTGVQIVNTVFLTDGEGHSMGASNYRYNSEKTYIHDPSTRKDYALNNDHRDETNVYLEILRNRTQCNIIGIRLHCAKNISNLRYSYIEENDIEASQRSFKKNNYCVASKGKTAYDEFFIVKADLNATEDIFAAIDDDASFAKIKNAFKKNAKSTKTSRVIATKMIEIFATNK